MTRGTALTALASCSIGFLLASGLGAERSDPLPTGGMPVECARALQRNGARLDEIERSLAVLAQDLRRAASQGPAAVRARVTTSAESSEGAHERDAIGAGGSRERRDDAPDSRENRQAYGASHDLVDAAISEGRWTEDDARELRSHASLLTPLQEMEVLRTLIVSINRGDVAVEGLGPQL